MDWVFNASSPWDLTGLDVLDDNVIMGKNQSMEADIGTMNNWSEQKLPTMSSSPSGSSKKQRGIASEARVSCLVDGCRTDLNGCRDYHRRHRVCETHSKTPVVTIDGKEQRFCQQCSRFHSLGEFDEVKRSCRKRLDGHNRRRRKPRAEPMYLNYGSFFTSDQGTKLLSFGGSPTHMTTFGTWPDNKRLNQKLHLTVEQSIPSHSYTHYRSARERKFPFLLDNDSEKVNQTFSEASFQQGVISADESAYLLVEPTGALSLLSKHTTQHTSYSGPTNLVQPSRTTLQFNSSLSQHSYSDLPLRDVTRLNSSHTNNHMIGMIHVRAKGLLENEAAEVLSFSWE
uniref:squamosa promoter-binding-like protein 13A isoform X1 n=1 Tax=Erigeron canadensis TaxID=72917 RepID=UPI001CB9D33D|nr:squamosa promoter-binding-like protein 13A isoform X1 [Erigeron canadensis]